MADHSHRAYPSGGRGGGGPNQQRAPPVCSTQGEEDRRGSPDGRDESSGNTGERGWKGEERRGDKGGRGAGGITRQGDGGGQVGVR